MFEETSPRNSAKWVPTTTFAAEHINEKGELSAELIADVERKGSVS